MVHIDSGCWVQKNLTLPWFVKPHWAEQKQEKGIAARKEVTEMIMSTCSDS